MQVEKTDRKNKTCKLSGGSQNHPINQFNQFTLNTINTMKQITKKMLNNIYQMTDNNQHGEVLQYIAKIIGHKIYEAIFTHINKLHDLEGSMPTDLREYRNRNRNEMFEYIKSEYGIETFNKIYSNL